MSRSSSPVWSDIFRRYWQELKSLLALATPLLTAQLLHTGMGTVDTLMAGNYHAYDLAAIAVGASLWLPLSLVLAGLMIAVTTLVARAFGAGDTQGMVMPVQQGLWLGLGLSFLAVIFLHNTEAVLRLFDVEETVIPIAMNYLQAVSWGMPAAAIFFGLRSFFEGMGHTRPYMVSCILAFVVNIPLNYGLIYGRWGLPELGGAGCGWATAIVMWLQVVVMLAYTQSSRAMHNINLYQRWSWPQLAAISSISALGIPIALAVFAEMTIFSMIALLLAPLGATMVAGHQIALSVSHLIFMIPLSLSQAVTIRVGQFLGQAAQTQANFVVKVAMVASLGLSAVTMVLIVCGREWIASLYTSNPEVIAIALPLFLLMAIYQFPDQIQIYANAALRAYHDTRKPLQMILLSYWGICLPLGYVLSRTDWLVAPMGAAGFWAGLVVGLFCTSWLLSRRLLRIMHQPLADLVVADSSADKSPTGKSPAGKPHDE